MLMTGPPWRPARDPLLVERRPDSSSTPVLLGHRLRHPPLQTLMLLADTLSKRDERHPSKINRGV